MVGGGLLHHGVEGGVLVVRVAEQGTIVTGGREDRDIVAEKKKESESELETVKCSQNVAACDYVRTALAIKKYSISLIKSIVSRTV